ncbi:MAG: sulfur oxidation c-type cytochrome SoxX [Thioalkalivibrionaceae bacterium]
MNKTLLATGLAIAFAFAGMQASAQDGQNQYLGMSPAEMAEKIIMESGSLNLAEPTQDGRTARERMQQDEAQRLCSTTRGEAPDAELAGQVIALARESITRPEGGVQLGDWRRGEAIAREGAGFRVGTRVDNHANRAPGGNCYACHAMSPNEIAYGTLGPSLTGYGKTRGTSEAMLNYVYEVVYNSHTYFPCSNMPRFGAAGVLTHEQILDAMAYLLDPESPVNQ